MEQRDRDVVHGNAGDCLSIELSVVSVAVEYEIGAMAIDDFGRTGRAEEGINFRCFSLNRCSDRSIMQHDYTLRGA